MLKTTCKKALDNIRAYILHNTDTSNYPELEEPKTFKEVAEIIIDTFYSEYMHGYNWKRNRQQPGQPQQRKCIEWAHCSERSKFQ